MGGRTSNVTLNWVGLASASSRPLWGQLKSVTKCCEVGAAIKQTIVWAVLRKESRRDTCNQSGARDSLLYATGWASSRPLWGQLRRGVHQCLRTVDLNIVSDKQPRRRVIFGLMLVPAGNQEPDGVFAHVEKPQPLHPEKKVKGSHSLQ